MYNISSAWSELKTTVLQFFTDSLNRIKKGICKDAFFLSNILNLQNL